MRIVGALALVAAASSSAQTTGDSTAGQQLFNTTLSPQCASCHSTTDTAAANSLTIIRTNITNRATPAGAAGTMSFAKALEALDRALTGTSLGGATTGMNGFYTLTSVQRGDLAAYIGGLAGPAPILSYSPSGGAIFAATAVGATTSATVTIRNTGTAPLTFATNNAVTLATGGDAADFRVSSSTCLGITLAPNSGSCAISVSFTPAAGSSLTRTAAIGLTTTTSTSLVPMAGSVAVATSAPPTGSAANPPSSGGGGGGLEALWVGLLLLAAAARRQHGPKP